MRTIVAATSAHATQDTFASAGPLNCTAVSICVQNTTDNLWSAACAPCA